ncbi:unnamed protein product [Phaedon cochleariae]|uniref:Frizzled-4 n=1 Tax=Phaedon cochleariae TaxID=80249 RepID=A0A9N9S7S8_PHACE|nr:unnamed protein product [Phaedon cochleariae]
MRTCEPIRVEMCMTWYNTTAMPNLGGNDIQKEAELQLQSFQPLIRYGCSQNLKLFLCSVYVPMCTEKVTNPIGPCRGLCEGVRARCLPILQGFGFSWADALNCSRFPETNNQNHMCIEGPGDEIDITAPVDPAVQKFDCDPHRMKNGEGCLPGCHSNSYFDESEKKFAEVWVTVWALICLVLSLGSALTLTVGGGRVKARPLVSLALCYVMVSIGWALRMFAGRSYAVGCPKAPEDGLSNINCACVFLLLWVCLCAWWVARVGLSWPPEKMRSLSSALHVCAWALPAAQTVAALVRRDVDSDELTGTCYIGNKKTSTLLSLVLLPYFFYFACGTILLFLGCSYVMRKPRSLAAAPLTNAAPRKESDFLGAICTLYAIPTFCVMASIYYEYNNRDKWISGERKPALWAFLLKYFMVLFIGVSSVFWIWSMKSVTAWKAVLRRLGPRKQPPLKVQTMPQVMRYMPAQTLSSNLSTTSKHSSRSHSHRKPRLHHMRSGSETVI